HRKERLRCRLLALSRLGRAFDLSPKINVKQTSPPTFRERKLAEPGCEGSAGGDRPPTGGLALQPRAASMRRNALRLFTLFRLSRPSSEASGISGHIDASARVMRTEIMTPNREWASSRRYPHLRGGLGLLAKLDINARNRLTLIFLAYFLADT